MSGRSPKTARRAGAAAADGAASRAEPQRLHGRVIAAHGRHYIVAPAAGGALLQCFPRG